MRAISRRVCTALIIGIAILVSPLAAAEEESEYIVVALQQDPTDKRGGGLEAACVALQLGTGLIMTQGATVDIFATLDGVYIGDSRTFGYKPWHRKYPNLPRKRAPQCHTQNGEAPLETVLHNFLGAGGTILLCPLCYNARGAFPIMTWTRPAADPAAVARARRTAAGTPSRPRRRCPGRCRRRPGT